MPGYFKGGATRSGWRDRRFQRSRGLTKAFRLENIERRFGKVQALDGLSTTVQRGQVYGVLGRNRAGKTTALRVLLGIIRPYDGLVELFGQRVKRVTPSLKRRIGTSRRNPRTRG